MSSTLQERVQARLDALDISPFEAARRAEFERSYVNDLLIGKKKTIRDTGLDRLATVLDCDPAYLLGRQDTPRVELGTAARMILAGIAEAGTWRADGSDGVPMGALPLAPDPRYPAGQQVAYLVRGDHAAGFGIGDGAIVVVLRDGGPYRAGDVVLARRERPATEHASAVHGRPAARVSGVSGTDAPDGAGRAPAGFSGDPGHNGREGREAEVSIRAIEGDLLVARPAPGWAQPAPILIHGITIVGRVIAAHRVF